VMTPRLVIVTEARMSCILTALQKFCNAELNQGRADPADHSSHSNQAGISRLLCSARHTSIASLPSM